MYYIIVQSNSEFVSNQGCVQSHTNVSFLNKQHGTDVFRDYYEWEGDLPDHMDWRTSGIITRVKDQVCIIVHVYIHWWSCVQLRCGSSYAFSAMGALEGINALAYKQLVTLSEQNIVDCSG